MKGGNGTMRGAVAANNNTTVTSPDMSKILASLTGGRKKRSSKKRGRTKKGCNKKGGMGFGGVIREALVPFGLYALQKRTQRRRNSSKKHMKNSRRKSRRTSKRTRR